MKCYSIREVSNQLNVTEAFVASYVFGEGIKRYRSKLQPRCHLIDEDGFQFIAEKARSYKRNRKLEPTGIV